MDVESIGRHRHIQSDSEDVTCSARSRPAINERAGYATLDLVEELRSGQERRDQRDDRFASHPPTALRRGTTAASHG